VAGPKYDYTQPAVDAIKNYVENGGRALFLIDPPLKLGREDNAGSPALSAVIQTWGVTINKDLALDTSGIGQILVGSRGSAGDELRLAADCPRSERCRHGVSASSHARSQDAGERYGREAILDFRQQLCHLRINSPEIRINPKADRKDHLLWPRPALTVTAETRVKRGAL
jgi:hypothetical protein